MRMRRASHMKILVVDDEKTLVKGIKFNLENDGYEVECAYDGEQGVELVRKGDIDLVILDLMMPKMDGFEACKRIREFSNVPIIMLTAKGEDTDKIIGFEYGADDYVTKPFNIMELKVRVRAILRRATSETKKAEEDPRIVRAHIELDIYSRNAYIDGNMIDLTAKEYDLIELLMNNPGRVYSRENLLNIVWGYEYPGDIRTVDVHIRRLREKLERNPAQPEFILTKWGVGYYFRA
jgi:two-component system response regulator VicR